MFENFLEKEEQRKYQFVHLLEKARSSAIPKSELLQLLDISDFILKRMTQSLLMDFQRFELDEALTLVISDYDISLQMNEEVSAETLLELYIKESVKYRLLQSAFIQKYRSLNEFSLHESTSYPIAHRGHRQLNEFLQQFDLKINRRFQVETTNEAELRFFLSELFLKIEKSDLSMYEQSSNFFISKQKKYWDMLHVSVFQRLRMEHYWYVIDIRLRQGSVLKTPPESEILDNDLLSKELIAIAGEFFEHFHLEKDVLVNEIHLLSRYYFSLESASYPLELPSAFVLHRWNQNLIRELQRIFPRLLLYPERLEEFNREIWHVHISMLTKGETCDCFIKDDLTIFFKKAHPEVYDFCRQYVNSLKQKERFLFKRQKSLFLNYCMTILNFLPKDCLAETTYVYIDFSHGDFYNRFIAERLKLMPQLGVVATPILEQADIVLTNSRRIALTEHKEFIIWLELPRAVDYEHLMQKAIEIRKNKMNQTVHVVESSKGSGLNF